MRIKSITTKDPGQNSHLTRDYTYSPVGNIELKDTEHGAYQYQYDELQRLTAAVNPLGADEAYTYDPLGNRLTAAGVTGTWSYNANNELLGYANVTFAYDDNGNTTRKSIGVQEFNYSYDVEDRLMRVEDGLGAGIADYYYDPFGRRLYKEVDEKRTYFVYSNEGLIGEYDETGAEIKTYGWVPDSQWSTDPLFYKQQGQYYWYQNDHLGTPQKIIATSGRVVWSAIYDSFGNCQIQKAEIENNLRFAGQYQDAETGLYYNLNRYYDPTIGRYLRIDPYGDGLNLYVYVFNNPKNLIDPLGLCAVKSGIQWAGNKLKQAWDWYLSHPLSLVADWWDDYAAQTSLILDDMVYSNGDLWWLAATLQTTIDVGSGFVDILRFGEGFAEGGWGYAKDVLRGLAIYGGLSRAAKALPGAFRSAKGIIGNNRGSWSNASKKGLEANPFKGKTPKQIDKMFKKKGFEPRGPDPVNGKGGYVDPKTGRSYHIDKANRYGEPPHVDVNRPRDYKGPLDKRKYGM